MPLSEPALREPLHRRAIEIRGYRRQDGLVDIEAHMTDQRAYDSTHDERGTVPANAVWHDMWLRLTINEAMEITACEACTDQGPFTICKNAPASMSRLVSMTIKSGFLKEAASRLGGVEGCTHLRELLQQVGTTAYQTMWPIRMRRGIDSSARLVNSCFAFASDGPVVRQRWPQHYNGPDREVAGKEAVGSAD